MKKTQIFLTILCGVFAVPAVQAQSIPDLKIGGETVQFHAFGSQGFAASDDNNFLTMKTSSGSFAMTDFGFNASTQINEHLRIGAQMYDYNVGSLGKWHPTLDWGYLDYKVKDWFGMRAGKVKTALGLYNDTQDTAFLYTWALMPQSIYPLDLRANSIAHLGGDIYGHLGLRKAGSLDYTGYYGYVPFDQYGGSAFSAVSAGNPVLNQAQRTGGEDIRWNTPITGLLLGSSVSLSNMSGYGVASAYDIPFNYAEHGVRTIASYGDYVHGKLHFSGEVRSNHTLVDSAASVSNLSFNAFFVGAAYRVAKHLELGSYNSRIYLAQSMTPLDPNSKHLYDQSVTARVDLTNFWNVKVEGHFMNGYGDLYSARGFYLADNPTGFKPNTNMVIVRTGINF